METKKQRKFNIRIILTIIIGFIAVSFCMFMMFKDILEVKEYSVPIMKNVVIDSQNVCDFYLYSTTSTEEYLSFINGFEGKEFTIEQLKELINKNEDKLEKVLKRW